MKLLFVHAHFDDFEFTAAGTFELWRRAHPTVARRILISTDGAAGHHAMSREATAARRWAEQQKAGALGGFEVRLLRDGSGSPFREGCLAQSAGLLPALWKEIREFEPDYLFCPPIPVDPLAGVHVDHLDVAEAVRAVAYLVNVPHAYLPEYPEEGEGTARAVRTPVILNTFDGYLAAGHRHDLAVDVGAVTDLMGDLAWCHESQLQEWLPWVDRHHMKASPDAMAWREQYRGVISRRTRALGLPAGRLYEVFQVTAWGALPTLEGLTRDFPGLDRDASRLEALGERLDRWHEATGA
ncbi:MAG: PIG-L family deacetylase [Verrucomicrobiae bacterium]|nr:PIG-L family deacetylase [Verrucomicrobiae bacterium]